MDAAYLGDEAAAKKWNITTRTIENYRARLKTDPKLSDLFLKKRGAAESTWADELKRALMKVIQKEAMIVDCIEPVIVVETDLGQQQEVNVEGLKVLIMAQKSLGELAIAMEVLNAGDAHQNAQPPEAGAGLAHRKPLPN